MFHDLPARGTRYHYHRVRIGRVFGENPFCYTLAKYATERPERVEGMVWEGEIPPKDLANLDADYEAALKRYRRGELTREKLEETRKYLVSGRVAEDVERVNDALRGIKERGAYYPPTTTARLSVMDGSHRVVALHYLLEAERRIFVWQMTQTLEELRKSSET